MKHISIFISTLVLFLFGCMKSQISDSLVAQTNENQFSVAVVLSQNITDEKFAKCIEKGLKKKIPKMRFMSGKKFRDTFYPWFEPSTAPDEKAELSVLMSKTIVRNQIEKLGLELLIYVLGNTVQSKGWSFGTSSYQGAFGYENFKRETHIVATIWNLKQIVLIGKSSVEFQGTVHIGIIGILPFGVPAFTESSACGETVERISNCLKGKDSHRNK